MFCVIFSFIFENLNFPVKFHRQIEMKCDLIYEFHPLRFKTLFKNEIHFSTQSSATFESPKALQFSKGSLTNKVSIITD